MVISGQESGLLAVVLLMIVGMWLAAPVTTRTSEVSLGATERVEVTEIGWRMVNASGEPTTYARAQGWDVAETRKEYPAGSQATIENKSVVITRPGGAPVRLTGEWAIERLDDGRIVARQTQLKQSLRYNTFLNSQNLINVATSASFYAIMAVGMTGIIVMGGIDLSIGSIYGVAAVVGALALRELPDNAGTAPTIAAALAVCCGVGALCGLCNGLGTVLLRVHPFIITLGTMSIFRGVAYLLTQGESISGFPPGLAAGLIRLKIGGLEFVPLLLTVLVAAGGAFLFTRTVFGRRTFAIGGNETAARYAGIPIGRVKVLLFVLSGALAGLAAVILLGRYGAADSTAGRGDELAVIASSVVGGASLSGGRGSALGAVLGAIIISLIRNATIILHIENQWTDVVLGLTIIIAVVVDQAKQRLSRTRRS